MKVRSWTSAAIALLGLSGGGALLAQNASAIPAICGSGAYAAGPPESCTYDSGGEDLFLVPAGVTSIHVTAIGGAGGDGGGLGYVDEHYHAGAGGMGAQVEADLSVSGGSVLYVEVGGNGTDGVVGGGPAAGGFNGGAASGDHGAFGDYAPAGGGGGGASDVRSVSRTSGGTLASRRLVAAGGGGGGGGGGYDEIPGDGGAGDDDGDDGVAGPFACDCWGRGGLAGSVSAGGVGGVAPGAGPECFEYSGPSYKPRAGSDGTSGTGGAGGCGDGGSGGGGGGGWFGGGGGSGTDDGKPGGGGGGGASFAELSATNVAATPDGTGAGSIVISWVVGGGEDDTTPPVVELSFPDANENGWYGSLPIVGSVTATDDGNVSDIECTGADLGTITGVDTTNASASLTVNDEGAPEISCTATDGNGNTSDPSAETLYVDVTKPNVEPDAHGYISATWTNQDVTVDFECTDLGNGASGVDVDTLVGGTLTESTDEGVILPTGDCIDKAGNTGDLIGVGQIWIDKTTPEIVADTHGYVVDTWSTGSVTVDFTCDDSGSGFAVDDVAGDTLSTDTDDGSITNTGDCEDNAGNVADPVTVSPIKIDTTAPVITATATKEGGETYVAGETSNVPVTVTFDCSDPGDEASGIDEDSVGGDTTISEPTDDGEVTSTGDCIDNAGNSVDPLTFGPIVIVAEPPLITADSHGYVSGEWTNQSVTIDFTCTPGNGALVTNDVAGTTLTADVTDGSVTNTGECIDEFGQSADAVTFEHIQIDTTKPVITAAAAKADTTTYTANTWTNQTVSVTFTCAEAGTVQSGIDTNDVAGGWVSSDTSTGSVTNSGSCTDNAGNSALAATFSPIKVDKTGPTVTPASLSAPADGFLAAATFTSSFPVTVGSSPITTSGTASDAGSGLATVTVNGSATTGTASWSKTGVALVGSGSTATVVATDAAGNTTSLLLATLQRDIDGDGIANNVDGNSSVNPAVGQALVASTRFSDKKLGGTTSGQITSKSAAATITITDATPGGVAVAVGGTGNAKLKLDGKAGTTTFPATSAGILTDPPSTTALAMSFGTGEIDYLVLGQVVLVDVGPGSVASVTESTTGGSLVGLTVVQTAGGSGGVTVNGKAAGAGSLAVKSLDVSATKLVLSATLTPGAGGSIAPPEQLVLDVGGFSATIPSSALVKTKSGWSFSQTVGGVALTGTLSKGSGTSYQVQVTGTGTNTVGSVNPITVAVRIGDDAGAAVVKAKIT